MSIPNGNWMHNSYFLGRCLRVFFCGRWRRPYGHRYLNMILFGIGPISFMYWPKGTNGLA